MKSLEGQEAAPRRPARAFGALPLEGPFLTVVNN